MIEMSPFYAHESKVGPVFDVATWSRAKAWSMALTGLVLGLLALAGLVFAWQPTLLLKEPPEVVAGIHEATLELAKEKPWIAYGVFAVGALTGLIALAGAFASASDALHGDYYFRAGPGGLSVRVPAGIDFRRFCLAFKTREFDLPVSRIADWTIVQHKQLGSMSRNTGNLSALFQIRTSDGKKVAFSLDCFREPSSVIQSKLNDARRMVPIQFGSADAKPSGTFEERTVSRIEAKFDAISEAISAMISDARGDSVVVVSDPRSDRCVQFVAVNGLIVLDLPEQGMDPAEQVRAADYLRRATGGDGGSSTQTGLQVSAANADDAARLAMEIFNHVYQLRPDEPLKVESITV